MNEPLHLIIDQFECLHKIWNVDLHFRWCAHESEKAKDSDGDGESEERVSWTLLLVHAIKTNNMYSDYELLLGWDFDVQLVDSYLKWWSNVWIVSSIICVCCPSTEKNTILFRVYFLLSFLCFVYRKYWFCVIFVWFRYHLPPVDRLMKVSFAFVWFKKNSLGYHGWNAFILLRKQRPSETLVQRIFILLLFSFSCVNAVAAAVAVVHGTAKPNKIRSFNW